MDGMLLRMTPPPGVELSRKVSGQFSLTSFPVAEEA